MHAPCLVPPTHCQQASLTEGWFLAYLRPRERYAAFPSLLRSHHPSQHYFLAPPTTARTVINLLPRLPHLLSRLAVCDHAVPHCWTPVTRTPLPLPATPGHHLPPVFGVRGRPRSSHRFHPPKTATAAFRWRRQGWRRRRSRPGNGHCPGGGDVSGGRLGCHLRPGWPRPLWTVGHVWPLPGSPTSVRVAARQLRGVRVGRLWRAGSV